MYVIHIIEEKPKIFTLLKNIISDMRKERYIFIDGNIVFSKDIEKNISENSVLIFQLIRFDKSNFSEYNCFSDINYVNLAFVGEIDNKIDIGKFTSIDSLMLNADNLDKIENAEKAKQVITCGLKEKDTVTFSSIEEDNIILNVQRIIKNIESADIEPFEKKIYIEDIYSKGSSEIQHEDLITALAILLFCNVL